jgi:hypothetical protein
MKFKVSFCRSTSHLHFYVFSFSRNTRKYSTIESNRRLQITPACVILYHQYIPVFLPEKAEVCVQKGKLLLQDVANRAPPRVQLLNWGQLFAGVQLLNWGQLFAGVQLLNWGQLFAGVQLLNGVQLLKGVQLLAWVQLLAGVQLLA